MRTLLSLTKDRDDALKAVASAAGPGARKKALSILESAQESLTKFKSTLASKAAARRPAAAAVAAEEEEEAEEDEEEESEEESEEEEEEERASDDEPKKPLMKKSKSKVKDEDEEEESEDDSDEEEEEEEEKARARARASARSVVSIARKSKSTAVVKAAISHRKALASVTSLAAKTRSKYAKLKAACAAVTGKRGLESIIGGIQGLAVKASKEEANAKDIAAMKAKTKKERVNGMLSAAVREGKIVQAVVPMLREQGMQNSKWLKGYIDALPKSVRTVTDGALEGRTFSGGSDATADKDRSTHLDFQSLDGEMKKFVTSQANAAGQSVEEFFKNMQKVSEKAANGSPLTMTRAPIDIAAHRTNSAS